jgi:threonine efflux protein
MAGVDIFIVMPVRVFHQYAMFPVNSMHMNSLLMLFIVHLLALMTPGPDFFIVSKVAISSSRRAAMMTAFGVAVGVMAWAGLALMGLHLLLERIAWLGAFIKIAGGLYLIYLGATMIKASLANPTLKDSQEFQQTMSDRNAFLRGLLTNLSNPKAAVYFGSIFATFLTHTTSTMDKLTMFSMVSIESMIWFSLVGVLFSLPALRRSYYHAQKWIDRIAGITFASFGLRLILTSRS